MTAERSRRLRPAEAGVIDVQVVVHCSVNPDPLPMRLSVETADERIRDVTYPMAYIGTAWHDRAMVLCRQRG